MSIRTLVLGVAALAAAGCANNDFSQIQMDAAPVSAGVISNYHIADVEVSFAPDAYLEWCEDDLLQCDNIEMRVAQTFKSGAISGSDMALFGGAAARLKIEVTKFDSITLASRYTTGGVHDVNATYTLVDAETGEALAPSASLDFDRVAWGRTAGLVARVAGRTQRVRISERIGHVTRDWLRAVNGEAVWDPAAETAAAITSDDGDVVKG